MPHVSVEALSKRFNGRAAVASITLDIPRGQFCVLLGPSGCGKSTTLRLIAGLEEPDAGVIRIDGRDVTGLPARERQIAMVFQSYALFPHLSVAENITFGLSVRGVARQEREARLNETAALVGLGDVLARKPSQLSGGQRQRVALARAVISRQPICLMDEPLSNLDAKLRGEMRLEIRSLQQRLGMTMIYVTHDQIEAMTMADRVILMKDGGIEQDGTPAELYDTPASMFAARFIGQPAMNLMRPGDATAARQIMIGVRAEHLRLGAPSGNGHDASVESIEYLGADTVVGLRRRSNETVAVRLAGRPALRLGEQAALVWDAAHEHCFDAASGRRLTAAQFFQSRS